MKPFRHYHRHPRFRGHAAIQSYTPKQVAALYSYPPGGGAGQKIAAISLGGSFSQADLDTCSKLWGIAATRVTAHLIAGATLVADPGGADVENMLDLCCIHGAAPLAEIHFFAAPNTDTGFAAAVQAAADADVDAISISWGAPEDQWSPSAKAAMERAFANAQAKSIVVTVASGDNGSSDGEPGSAAHVDYPASSPHVVGCGGTTIKSPSPLAEIVWNDGSQGGATGGGVSADFAIPPFQSPSAVPGGGKRRAVPDVALNADPESGYLIIEGGQQQIIGGTSGAAPMMAALVACLNSQLGKRIGNFNSAAYPLTSAFRDITSGNNGVYIARSGFDCCTGNGVPIGSKLLAALSGTVVTPPIPTSPITAPTVHTLVFSLPATLDGRPVS